MDCYADTFMNGEKRDETKGGLKRALLQVSTLSINLVLSSAAGLAAGYFLDKWLKTQPVLTILFFCIGTFAGFRQIFREMQRMGSDEKKHERN